MKEYGESIMAERARKRISQADLAKRLGWYPSTLVEIELGRVGVDSETYRRVLDAIEGEEEAKETLTGVRG